MTFHGNPTVPYGQRPVQTRSFSPNGGASVPGTDTGFSGFNPGGNLPTPYQPPTQVTTPAVGAGAGAGSGSGGLLANLPLKDIKGFIDRMGGIDGIMNTVNKMQGYAETFQKMSPMIKLLMGSFLKKGSSTDKFNEDYKEYRRRRRRRKRRNGRRRPVANRRPVSGGRPRRRTYGGRYPRPAARRRKLRR